MDLPVSEDLRCYASKAQREVLLAIAALDPIGGRFFLTGGTALSVFYLHHRTSEDLDFFSPRHLDLGPVNTLFHRLFRDEMVLTQAAPSFLSCLIRGVKVDVVIDPLSTDAPRPWADMNAARVLIDTLDDIAANKLCAVVSRFEAKDLVDLYFIGDRTWRASKEARFRTCYERARQREALLDDPATAAYQAEQLLEWVLAKRHAVLPPMLLPLDWPSFEVDLRLYIRLLYGLQHW